MIPLDMPLAINHRRENTPIIVEVIQMLRNYTAMEVDF